MKWMIVFFLLWVTILYIFFPSYDKWHAATLADSAILKAKGIAESNKIIGESLKDNEEALKFIFIDSLKNTKNQVIYVPTENNMPKMDVERPQSKTMAVIRELLK